LFHWFTGFTKSSQEILWLLQQKFLAGENSDVIPDAQPTPTISRVEVFMFHSTQKYVISEKFFLFHHLGWY